MSKTRHIIDLIINLLVVVLVTYAMSTYFTTGGAGNMQVYGVNAFKFFTNDSNILAAVGCTIAAVYNIKALAGAKQAADTKTASATPTLNAIPHTLFMFKWVGTVAVTITFLVVLCFLGPLMGYGFAYEDANLWLHGVCPVLCIVSSLFIERDTIKLPEAFLGLIPVVIYGAVYFVMVIVIGKANGGWADFYMFNMGGMWPITIIVMAVVTAGVSLLERIPHRK